MENSEDTVTLERSFGFISLSEPTYIKAEAETAKNTSNEIDKR